jgi:hypothetical protein
MSGESSNHERYLCSPGVYAWDHESIDVLVSSPVHGALSRSPGRKAIPLMAAAKADRGRGSPVNGAGEPIGMARSPRRKRLGYIKALLLSLLIQGFAHAASATDLAGRVAAIDLDKQTIALKVGDDSQTFDLAKKCKVYRLAGGKKGSGYNEEPDGLKAVETGQDVTATTDFLDGNEQVVRIRIETPTPAKKHHRLGRDVSGKVSAIDADKGLIALTIGDKEQKFALDRNCNVFMLVGGGTRAHYDLAPDGLAAVKVGIEVTINLISRDGKELVDYIQITPPRKPKRK